MLFFYRVTNLGFDNVMQEEIRPSGCLAVGSRGSIYFRLSTAAVFLLCESFSLAPVGTKKIVSSLYYN